MHLWNSKRTLENTQDRYLAPWRILKTDIRLHGVDATEKVWLTCCALPNWLIKIDGLDSQWEAGVSSDWEGDLGQLNCNNVELLIK